MNRPLTTITLLLMAAVLWVSSGEGARRNGTVKLPLKERYRRLIPYMTFYLQQQQQQQDGAATAAQQYRQTTDSNLLEQSRYQGYNQGYNHGFVHNSHTQTGGGGGGPASSLLHQYQPHPNYYLQGPSVVKQVVQNYLSVKNRPVGGRQQYTGPGPQAQVQPPQPPRLPQQPKFLTGFKPMDPNSITITQSQEIQVQQSTSRPYDISNAPRPYLVEHNSLRPYITDQQSQQPYVSPEVQSSRPYVAPELESSRPYVAPKVESPRPYVSPESEPPRTYVTPVPESPRPFIVAVEPNSQPRLPPVEQSSQSPFVQYVTTTYKPQFYTPVSNHIYPTSAPDYDTQDEGIESGYDISNVLPTRITSDNLESSIKTLSKLLQILQKANALPQSAKKLTKVTKVQGPIIKYPLKVKPLKQHQDEDFEDEGSTPGKPGVDYPAYTKIPQTSFSCKQQRYKGFFGDPETNCQVWHYCDLNGGQASFLCPNGTIFSQVALTCDWWFNVKCASTAQLYVLNERLYKYIIPQKPSFPEDFAGPLVDRYLEQKYRELEEQRRKNSTKAKDDEDDEEPDDETNEARRAINY